MQKKLTLNLKQSPLVEVPWGHEQPAQSLCKTQPLFGQGENTILAQLKKSSGLLGNVLKIMMIIINIGKHRKLKSADFKFPMLHHCISTWSQRLVVSQDNNRDNVPTSADSPPPSPLCCPQMADHSMEDGPIKGTLHCSLHVQYIFQHEKYGPFSSHKCVNNAVMIRNHAVSNQRF